jgi:hypothetical protein
MEDIDARFAELLDRHLGAHLCPLIEAINALAPRMSKRCAMLHRRLT